MTEKTGMTRRVALQAAAAVAGGIAGVGAATGLARAQSSTSTSGSSMTSSETSNGAMTPQWHRVSLGEAKVTTILDGTRPGDGPYPTFGSDQSAEAMAALMRENYLPEDKFVNMFNPVVIEIGGELVLFDTGMGPMGRANGSGHLRSVLPQAGYKPEDVSIVVLTHFHGDHIGGLMEEDGPAFPNARYVAGQKEWDFWTSDAARSGPSSGGADLVQKNVVPLKDKMTFIRGGDAVIAGITGMDAFGHTPGHMVFEVKSGDRTLMLTADTANHFVASLQRPDWQVKFDMDKDMAAATRKAVFDRIAAERLPFIGYHMPFPSLGYAKKEGEGYRFIPETYQLEI
ncbi:MBL fold metallo-hydrolase [Mangrovibrevibacter kandeliae]|uniref:MBL fold metallo-hydrolase n=1 Tax=Mangrovibrevibacter kandeliae TaxID=2968473 RepID=UPI0021185BED|nr:MBL fold metallo-hydrolase [Aurantimonas sp. CSK15Z-1]MCQ8782939.1 MBL fold metallo-hydrolase [Aurantimonas sp. CSK15Z-1]